MLASKAARTESPLCDRPGGRRTETRVNVATIHDVARLAGVSTATVSRVLNGTARVSAETERLVKAAAARVDYWPNSAARSLSTKRAHALGVLLPDLYGEFYSEVIRGIDEEARHEKLQILLSSSHADVEEIVGAARSMRGRVDGLIAMAPDADSVAAVQQVSRSTRIVLLNPWLQVDGCNSVSIANFEGALAMVRHLLGLGHRRIAMLRGPQGNIDADERYRGYATALEEAGIRIDPELVFDGDFTERFGYACGPRIRDLSQRPSAVFAANDCMAIGFMSALRGAGLRVPHDIAVAGFDDIATAPYLSPSLTTVRVRAHALGLRGVRLWVDSGHNGDRAGGVHEVLPVVLVIRASCGAGTGATKETEVAPGGRKRIPARPVAGAKRGRVSPRVR
jgi:LacI family transcriptional regulator